MRPCSLQVPHFGSICRFIEWTVTEFKERTGYIVVCISDLSDSFIAEHFFLCKNRSSITASCSVYAVFDVRHHFGRAFFQSTSPCSRLSDRIKVCSSCACRLGNCPINRRCNNVLPNSFRRGENQVAASISGNERLEVAKHIVHQERNNLFRGRFRRHSLCNDSHCLCLECATLNRIHANLLCFQHQVSNLLCVRRSPDKISFILQLGNCFWVRFLVELKRGVNLSLSLYNNSRRSAAVFCK